MKIVEKLNMTSEQFRKEGAVNIVALGDSVTQGQFAADEIDYEAVYWNVLRRKINEKRNTVPVNVINSGIGATTSKMALERLERDVLSHHPDLVIVCFGLNEVNFPLEDFLSSLEKIFTECNKICDVIYLTPCMLNTYVCEKTHPRHMEYAHTTMQYQLSGKMDLYIEKAKEIAEELGVPVCDCYGKIKKMADNGIDTTALLANYVNHPSREIHQLFADSLYEIIFCDGDISEKDIDNLIK